MVIFRQDERISHGGALAQARARYGEPQNGWIDLSTGINPWAYPVPVIKEDFWRRLPDQDLEQAAAEAAKKAYDVGEEAHIVTAPGTQALLQLLPLAIAEDRRITAVAIVGPTYAEHALCWRRIASVTVHEVETLEQAEAVAPMVVIVNPNNPDGRRIAPQTVCATAERLASRGGGLVVDEAFTDLYPDISVAGQVGLVRGLVVLRSFGKFFGLAGIRLGFALAPKDLASRLSALLGPWAVSGPALLCGAVALKDEAWAEATRARLTQEADILTSALVSLGFSVVGGTDLFRLVSHDHAWSLAENLARNGILVRRFSGQRHWLRFGLPDTAQALTRLVSVLRCARNQED